jgi:hypothetical protein
MRAALAQEVGQLGPAPFAAGRQKLGAVALAVDAVELGCRATDGLNL